MNAERNPVVEFEKSVKDNRRVTGNLLLPVAPARNPADPPANRG